jgi:hypothetical protein
MARRKERGPHSAQLLKLNSHKRVSKTLGTSIKPPQDSQNAERQDEGYHRLLERAITYESVLEMRRKALKMGSAFRHIQAVTFAAIGGLSYILRFVGYKGSV